MRKRGGNWVLFHGTPTRCYEVLDKLTSYQPSSNRHLEMLWGRWDGQQMLCLECKKRRKRFWNKHRDLGTERYNVETLPSPTGPYTSKNTGNHVAGAHPQLLECWRLTRAQMSLMLMGHMSPQVFYVAERALADGTPVAQRPHMNVDDVSLQVPFLFVRCSTQLAPVGTDLEEEKSRRYSSREQNHSSIKAWRVLWEKIIWWGGKELQTRLTLQCTVIRFI